MENVQATVEQSSTVTWNIKPAEIPKENPIQYSDDLPKETYDKLPDEEINLVQDQSEPLVSLMSNSEIIEENSTAVSGNILMDREDGNGDFSTQEVPTSSLTGDVPEVVELIDIVASNETTTFGIMEEEEEKVLDDGIQKREDQKDYTFSSHETVEESGGIEAIPVKLLAASELEESSSTSESSLPVDGEKYKDMSLEDKAFAILSDLGMLQKDNLSVASPTIEQKVVDFEESMMDVLSSDQSYANLKEATMPDVDILLESEADKCDDKLPADGVPGTTGQSLQERVVRPIRSFLSQPRSEPLFSRETEMTPTDLILDVRKQPKSPEVEAQLASKYTQIEDLGDRAFTILKDLGMVGN